MMVTCIMIMCRWQVADATLEICNHKIGRCYVRDGFFDRIDSAHSSNVPLANYYPVYFQPILSSKRFHCPCYDAYSAGAQSALMHMPA